MRGARYGLLPVVVIVCPSHFGAWLSVGSRLEVPFPEQFGFDVAAVICICFFVLSGSPVGIWRAGWGVYVVRWFRLDRVIVLLAFVGSFVVVSIDHCSLDLVRS